MGTRKCPCSCAFSVELFVPAEVAEISTAVDEVPAELRHDCGGTPGTFGMATIGEPFYRNRDRHDYYTACTRAEGRALYHHFRLVHERVARFFEHRYALAVVYDEELAVPGFHLFDFEVAGEYEGGGWHVDSLETQTPYLAARADIAAVVNFTVPFELPDGGSGMELEADLPGSLRRGCHGVVPNRHVYGSYWNRILTEWPDRRLDEPTPTEIKALAEKIKTTVVLRRNARGGHGAAEHLIAAFRCVLQPRRKRPWG